MKSHCALVNGDVGEWGQRVDSVCVCAENRGSCQAFLLRFSNGPPASPFSLKQSLHINDSGEGSIAKEVYKHL